MNKFIQYLKEKGYKTTAMGKQKSYWLELEWNNDLLTESEEKYYD